MSKQRHMVYRITGAPGLVERIEEAKNFLPELPVQIDCGAEHSGHMLASSVSGGRIFELMTLIGIL